MRLEGNRDQVVVVEYDRVPIEDVLLSDWDDVMHENLAVDRPVWYGEIATVVAYDDLSADSLPLIGLIERLVEIAMPAESRVGDDAVELEIVESTLEIWV